jgi:ABC-type nickel/cobalt efflux system permease component RcnA
MRGVLLVLAACLIVFQSVAFRASAGVSSESSLAPTAEYCAIQKAAAGPSDAPGHHHHRHHHHDCVGCSASQLAAPVRAAMLVVLARLVPVAHTSKVWPLRDESPPPLSGWSSSWSSRAPPAFS